MENSYGVNNIIPKTGSFGLLPSGLVLYNGMLVCDDGFSDTAAAAICREMGFYRSTSWNSGDSYGTSGYDIGLDEVNCSNTNWDSCTYETSHDCSRSESVKLSCV